MRLKFLTAWFNPVFYGKVISGSHDAKLDVHACFENAQTEEMRLENIWHRYKWKEISTIPEHQNKVNVSHIDSIMMHSAFILIIKLNKF